VTGGKKKDHGKRWSQKPIGKSNRAKKDGKRATLRGRGECETNPEPKVVKRGRGVGTREKIRKKGMRGGGDFSGGI